MEREVDIDSTIKITFNNSANKESIEKCLSVTEDGVKLDGSITWTNAMEFTYTPNNQFKFNSRYVITLTRNALDKNGNKMEQEFVSEFYAGNDADYPYVISSDPASGETQEEIDKDTNIKIIFSKPMDKQETENSFSISPSIAGYFEWTDSDTQLTYFTTNSFDANNLYHVAINDTARDKNGNSIIESYDIYFYTGSLVFEKPELLQIYSSDYGLSPDESEIWAEGAVNHNVSKNDTITMRFSKNMNKQSVEDAFSISPSISGSFNWINSQLLIFTPDIFFDINSIYTLKLNNTAQSADDLDLIKNYYIILNINNTDSQHLTLGSVYGTDDDNNYPYQDDGLLSALDLNQSPVIIDLGDDTTPPDGNEMNYIFKLYFERNGVLAELDPESVYENISVKTVGEPNSNIAELINISVAPSPENAVIVELNKMSNTFSGVTETDTYIYYLKINGGENGIQDIYGNYLANDNNFYFSDM